MNIHSLDSRQLATVLAGLRYWQRRQAESLDVKEQSGRNYDYMGCWDVASDGGTLDPLSVAELDDLCEQLNVTETQTGKVFDQMLALLKHTEQLFHDSNSMDDLAELAYASDLEQTIAAAEQLKCAKYAYIIRRSNRPEDQVKDVTCRVATFQGHGSFMDVDAAFCFAKKFMFVPGIWAVTVSCGKRRSRRQYQKVACYPPVDITKVRR